jgi:hypothetical protein
LKQKWVIVAVAVVVVGVVYFVFKNQIDQALANLFPSTYTPPPTTPSGQGQGTAKYPVTIYSNSSDILSAFTDSGYLAQLQASINSGLYSASYLDALKANPSNWLAGHPYLFDGYPLYFKKA